MLSHLSIRNIILIEAHDITFHPGMTILTGETGAGKSILLDALSLALGGRGDSGIVRAGAHQGSVSAAFDLSPEHRVFALLGEDLSENTGELILKRVQHADGRTHAFINDQRVSASRLREAGELLVEIHGQHESRALVDAKAHMGLLDAFGGLEPLCISVSELWTNWRTLVSKRDALAAKIAEVEREGDYLRASLEELEALAPQSGEEEALSQKRQNMMVAEKIATDLADMLDILNGGSSPVPTLSSLLRRLERKRDTLPGLSTAADQFARSLDALEEARASLEEAFRATEFSPEELEETEERLFALRASGRKFRVPCDELPEVMAKMANQLQALDHGIDQLGAVKIEIERAEAAYFDKARTLSNQRSAAAKALETAVMAELPALKLEKASFHVVIESNQAKAASRGVDQVAFYVCTNPGAEPGPLSKIASGGEQSRILLALKVALADKGSAPTLIFDEIDTGVGGAVAEAMGLRLARLAERVQVLSVTHAPQVAACAHHHLLLTKTAKTDHEVITSIEPLIDEHRLEEIARMLAGATITEEARAAAGRLLERS